MPAGTRFDDWEVLEYSHTQGGHAMYRCRCVCGQERIVSGCKLRAGRTKGCGCKRHRTKMKIEKKATVAAKKGRSDSVETSEWVSGIGIYGFFKNCKICKGKCLMDPTGTHLFASDFCPHCGRKMKGGR